MCAAHMALHLYFIGCLLLLTWNYGTTAALPVRHDPSRVCANSVPLFKSLLLSLSDLVNKNESFPGIRLEKFLTLESSPSETVLACAPVLNKTMRCQALRKESFNEDECLKHILKDLVHYEGIISSYIKLTNLLSPEKEIPPFEQTLNITQNLLHAFSVAPTEEKGVTWKEDTFSNRQKMLKWMRAFYIRSITFNRAVGYIASGEHKNSSPF